MPRITKIIGQRRRDNRSNIYLDGRFAFGCNDNVVARFHLRTGLELSPEQLRQIEFGEVRQECFDKAMGFLALRLHSRAELFAKLKREQWSDAVIDAVIEDLTRMGYLDDARFARTKATSSAKDKHHGRRRAFLDLIRSGVTGDVAAQALNEVYDQSDPMAIAREVALKQVARLRRLDPTVARRRLAAALQRRGFDYDDIRPVIDQVLGQPADADAEQQEAD